MKSWKAGLAIISATISTTIGADSKYHHTVPLWQHKEDDRATHQNLDGHNKHIARAPSSPLEFGPRHWWYGSFDVGESKNLSLIIDTASTTLYLNPGIYKPSSQSVHLNLTINNGFGTWFKDGCGQVSLQSHVYADDVTMLGLTVEGQRFLSLVESPPKGDGTHFPHDGIFGTSRSSGLSEVGWIDHLCNRGTIDECRYGLALGTAGTGNMIVGSVDDSLFEGNLTKLEYPGGWRANVMVNGTKTLIPNRTIGLLDSGTANIIVPPADARAIFDHFGIQTVEEPPGWRGDCPHPVTAGYYPCDKPPTVGLQLLLPGSDEVNGPVFNIEPEAFKLADNGNNNCTAIIVGWESEDGFWNVGQPWFQGKYMDSVGLGGYVTGVATLKDKTVGAAQAAAASKDDASGGL